MSWITDEITLTFTLLFVKISLGYVYFKHSLCSLIDVHFCSLLSGIWYCLEYSSVFLSCWILLDSPLSYSLYENDYHYSDYLYSIVLYCIKLHYIILYYIVLHYIRLYWKVICYFALSTCHFLFALLANLPLNI